jgi:nucleotide-binding universal stress UspA family protein
VAEGQSIADEIVSTAVQEDCAFIVMGCRQQGLVAKAMGDKLVRKVLKRSSVPVFVVPRDRE